MLLPTSNSTILMEIHQQENLIVIFLSQINLDEYISTKINTFRIYKGDQGVGASPKKEYLKNQSKWRLLLFLAFWQGSLYPQNYELAP